MVPITEGQYRDIDVTSQCRQSLTNLGPSDGRQLRTCSAGLRGQAGASRWLSSQPLLCKRTNPAHTRPNRTRNRLPRWAITRSDSGIAEAADAAEHVNLSRPCPMNRDNNEIAFVSHCIRKEFWWPRAELNHRHTDFQSAALPTELLGQACDYTKVGGVTGCTGSALPSAAPAFARANAIVYDPRMIQQSGCA